MLCLDVSNTQSSGTSEKVPNPVCAHQKAASVNQEETPWHRATSFSSSPSGLRDLSCSCKRGPAVLRGLMVQRTRLTPVMCERGTITAL